MMRLPSGNSISSTCGFTGTLRTPGTRANPAWEEWRICSGCGKPVERIKDVGNPWLDAGIVPFSTIHFREDPEYWGRWFPADFITESFPGQFRNWFYSMLAMSTVLRREPPFKTIFGYALVFGEDGRPMHKSWGNAIEFDEAAERMGVDVMRWMFARARPEENILFGGHAADEARQGPAEGEAHETTRGTLISRFSFAIDVNEWGFHDLRQEKIREMQRHPDFLKTAFEIRDIVEALESRDATRSRQAIGSAAHVHDSCSS